MINPVGIGLVQRDIHWIYRCGGSAGITPASQLTARHDWCVKSLVWTNYRVSQRSMAGTGAVYRRLGMESMRSALSLKPHCAAQNRNESRQTARD